MEYSLYKIDNTKIAFKYYQPINFQLYSPIFNYLKFYINSHFIQYIQNYSSIVHNNIVYKKVAHKYFLKVLDNKIDKKEYNLQIWQHNVYYINIITMKNLIILEKVKKIEKLLETVID